VAALETENKLLVNGQKGSSFFFFEVWRIQKIQKVSKCPSFFTFIYIFFESVLSL
jgi:hypothetical protein